MSFAEHKVCSLCGTTYLNGTPHECPPPNPLIAAENKLELYLGEFTIEDE